MRKICSLILVLVAVLSCLTVNANFNWATDVVPDLTDATVGNMVYMYSINPRKGINASHIDAAAQQEIVNLIKNYDFVVSDKTMTEEEFGTGSVPKDMIFTILFDKVWVSLLEDCVIFKDQIERNKITYCEYSDNLLLHKIEEILQPFVEKYQEQQKTETEKPDLGIPVTDFKKIYKASFSTGNDYTPTIGEWGLCSYKTDKILYGAYLYIDGFCMIAQEKPVNNTFTWDSSVFIVDSKEYTEAGSDSIATVKIKIDEDYNVVSMEMRYNQHREMSVIDMSTYQAEGSLKNFSDFVFELTKEEKQPVTEKEEKPDTVTNPEEDEKEVRPVEEDKNDNEKVDGQEQETTIDAPMENENSSDWAKGDIKKAKELNIIDVKGSYDYTASITREEFCEIIYNYCVNVIGKLESVNFESKFTDTDNVHIGVLNAVGIINGKSETKFAPDDFLTREEAATILARMVNYTLPVPVTEMYFEFRDSNKISDWANDSVQIICNMGVMKGIGNNMFAPKDTYTTEQAIATVVRLYATQSVYMEKK